MDKNIIIRRLQSARHLLSDDDILDLDCCHLALGNIDDALEELQKSEEPVQRFINVTKGNRDQLSIPVADIAAVYDFSGDNSSIVTRNNEIYYCELSRKQVVELINRQ